MIELCLFFLQTLFVSIVAGTFPSLAKRWHRNDCEFCSRTGHWKVCNCSSSLLLSRFGIPKQSRVSACGSKRYSKQVLYNMPCLAVDTINGLASFAWVKWFKPWQVPQKAAQRALLSGLCRQDIHRCGARPDGMYIWDRGRSWRQRDKDTQSWRGTRTRARHRPALSYASVAMCAWHLAGPRLSIDSLCVAQNMPAGHRGQWRPSPLTSIKRRDENGHTIERPSEV